MEATITYRPDAQKTPGLFDAILTERIIQDICHQVTGQDKFKIIRDTATYNRGRLIKVEYQGVKNYVSLSETSVEGRNQSLQSIATAINLFYADSHQSKRIYFYFMPHNGNYFTDYHIFYFRLLKTAGIELLNIHKYYRPQVHAFVDIDELIESRNESRESNSSNNSSFISKTSDKVQIYAKTYGASKYESTLLALAASAITDRPIDLYNICEQGLNQLPQSSLNTLNILGNITIHNTSITLEKRRFISQTSYNEFRSPIYQRNLLQRLGSKRCTLCGCEIPEIIQGAHIWGVTEIAREKNFSSDAKFEFATDGDNGLWLCQNHHKLFDSHLIALSAYGYLLIAKRLRNTDINFIRSITKRRALDERLMSSDFKWYLSQRNSSLDLSDYEQLA